jgi:flagellar biogenesis protein FliO
MKNLMNAIQTWYQGIPSNKRWAVWAFACLVTGFSLVVVFTGTASSTEMTADPGSQSAFLAMDVLVKLTVVILLIFVAATVYKKWNRGTITESLRMMNVRETIRLTPKQGLHLVQVGDETYLVGATDQAITLISQIDIDPQAVLTNKGEPQANFLDFFQSRSNPQAQPLNDYPRGDEN